MPKLLRKFKTNKAFTLQDVTIAIIILLLMTGIIFELYLTIYRTQSNSILKAQATAYAIQILENTDKISYDEVTNGMEEAYKTTYNIPGKFKVKMQVSEYNEANTIKKIELTINYELGKQNREVFFEKFKVKEL